MHLEQRLIVYDASFRFIVILFALCYRFLDLGFIISPALLKNKVLEFTQISFYNPLATYIPLFFILFLIKVTKRQRGDSTEEVKMHQDLTSRSIFPTVLIEIYFITMYFGVRSFVYSHTDHFKASGHLFRSGLGSGIWLRNYSWVLRHKHSFPGYIRVFMSGSIFIMLAYIAYENFWTTLYFHTPSEVLLGFLFATLNIFFPTLKRVKRWIGKVDRYHSANEDKQLLVLSNA